VRDKTTVPVHKAARAVVYGLIGVVVGTITLVLLVVAIFRLHVYIPAGENEGRKVWIAYVAVGAIFVLLGGLLWRRRKPRPKE
jgi:multisubunit Na+/H+ antiporter MnhB subunit